MKKSNKALAYIRVSTGKQDLSMEAQEEKIRLYCQLNGLDLVEVIRERAVTAKIKLNKRPEGSRIEKMLPPCHSRNAPAWYTTTRRSGSRRKRAR